jgi:hypothetical protein
MMLLLLVLGRHGVMQLVLLLTHVSPNWLGCSIRGLELPWMRAEGACKYQTPVRRGKILR